MGIDLGKEGEFLKLYADLKSLHLEKLIRELLIEDTRGLIDNLSTEETAELLGFKKLF